MPKRKRKDVSWVDGPRARRVLADLAEAIVGTPDNEPRVALFVGAGVDCALTNRPAWTGLIRELAVKCELKTISDPLSKVAMEYPVEAAQALRVSVGKDRYQTALFKATKSKTLSGKGMAYALKKLADLNRIRLIVSFNFTRDIVEALSSKKPTIIQKFHLGSWNRVKLLRPKSQINLIAIHGINDGNTAQVVLDRRSYDDAVFTDLHYSDLLGRVLQDYLVLTIGLSWNDIPLRQAAARVRYSAPISCHTHVALLRKDDGRPARSAPTRDLWRERSLASSYGVRPVYYGSKGRDYHGGLLDVLGELDNLIECLGSWKREFNGKRYSVLRDPMSPEIGTTLSKIADNLDSCGDYESVVQRQFFALHWQQLKEILSRRATEHLTFTEWEVLARLERHLRHFLWVYEQPDKRDKQRQTIWLEIASAGNRFLPDVDARTRSRRKEVGRALRELATGRDRALFEFALGAYELFAFNATRHRTAKTWAKVLDHCVEETRFSQRVRISKNIWKSPSMDEGNLRNYRDEAVKAGWESIEAKLALDICELRFRKTIERLRGKGGIKRTCPRDLPRRKREELLFLAEDAREVARMAGAGRRELGAITLGSLVSDPMQAEGDLLAINRSYAQQTSGGPGLVGEWNIYVGLLALLVEQNPNVKARKSLEWLEERCGEVNLRLKSPQGFIIVIGDHWRKYHSLAAELAAGVAKLVAMRPSSVPTLGD